MSKSHASFKDFFNVEKGERVKTFGLFTWLFLFICCYYVLRPIRRGMVLDGLGNDYMPFVYMGTALVTGIVVWIYSKFAYLPRRKLIGSIYGIFFVNLVMWWQAFQFESKLTSGLFWIWLDVFSIMGVTLFWMYANDLFNSSSAKRLFGIIAAGGGLGAVLGSTITASLVVSLGATNMLLVAAGLVAATLGIFLVIEKSNDVAEPVKRVPSREFEKEKVSGLGEAFRVLFSSKLLMLLTLVVCFERITPDLIQFVYHEVLNNLATGRDAIAALDANLERWRAMCEFVIELFCVGIVLKRVGSAPCLASSGVAIAASLITFAIFANPMIIVAIFHVDEALRHSWFKAAKELTYTVTSRDVLYTIKPIIEMFCYRFSRGFAGVLILLVNSVFGLGTPGIVAMGVICASTWVVVALKLNAEFKRLELDALFKKQSEGDDAAKKAEKELVPA